MNSRIIPRSHPVFCLYSSPWQVLYCNSMGCPSGYTPIDNAKDVECEDDPCEVSQCCEAFCSYYACPDKCIPVTGADTILCDDSGCTTELCCDCGESLPILSVLKKNFQRFPILARTTRLYSKLRMMP